MQGANAMVGTIIDALMEQSAQKDHRYHLSPTEGTHHWCKYIDSNGDTNKKTSTCVTIITK
jgi:hypothetical protein